MSKRHHLLSRTLGKMLITFEAGCNGYMGMCYVSSLFFIFNFPLTKVKKDKCTILRKDILNLQVEAITTDLSVKGHH